MALQSIRLKLEALDTGPLGERQRIVAENQARAEWRKSRNEEESMRATVLANYQHTISREHRAGACDCGKKRTWVAPDDRPRPASRHGPFPAI